MKTLLVLLLAGTSLVTGSADPFELREPTEKNIVYGMDHGSALLMDRYQPSQPNGYALVFIMGTGFTAYGAYDDIPLKELDRSLLQFGVFSDYYGEKGQPFLKALDAGFTVFSINHRLGPKHVWEEQLRDCQRAVQFIRYNAEQFAVSKDWIAGMGHSSGASMTSYLAFCDDVADPDTSDPISKESSRIQAAVLAAGVYDLNAQLGQRPQSALMLLSLTGKAVTYQPPGHPIFQRFSELSSRSFVSPDDAPCFLIHGTADDAVDLQQSKILLSALLENEIPATLLTLEGANHAELGETVSPPAFTQASEWLLQQLPTSN